MTHNYQKKMINKGSGGTQLKTRQPQDTTQTVEAIEEELRKNKQEFKDNDSNNVSMDDDDIDAEIGTVDQDIESNRGDQQALSKYERSKELLIQRKSILQIKKDMLNQDSPMKSDSQLLPQAEGMKEELIQLERYFTNEWGLELSGNPASAQFAAFLQASLLSEELLLDFKEKIHSLKKMRDSALELLAEAEIDPDQDLTSKVKIELKDVRVSIESSQRKGLAKEVTKKQAEESRLQRILTFLDDIQSLLNKQQQVVVQLPQIQLDKSQSVQYEQEKEEEKKQPAAEGGPSERIISGAGEDSENDSEFLNIMNEMKYYPGLPEGCFEKCLTQILCAIFLKTGKPSMPQYSELKQYLDLNLQDDKKLDSTISNGITMLKKLRETEQIENKTIVNLLKQLNELKHPISKDKLLVLKKDQIFWQILSEMRRFHFSLFFDYSEQVKKVAELVDDMDIVFLMGTTGCGKSTTIQYLCGSEMYTTKVNGLPHIGYKNIQNQDLKDVKTSPFARSETRFIKLIKIDQKNQNQQSIQMNLVDSPGLFDTKSPEIDVSNQIGIYEAFCKARTAKPVIILSLMKFGDRGEDFKTIIKFYASMLQDLERLKSFFFLFSHVKQYTMESLKNQLVEYVETEEKSVNKDDIVIEFIETILEKFDSGTVSLINPLDPTQVFPILQKIKKGQPIRQPEGVFQKSILESSKICINEQIQIHQQEVLHAIQTFKNETYACYKLEQLQRYAKLFDQYQEYNNCIIKISSILNKEYEKICNQIGTSLKKENNLSNTDINDIKNSYEYLNTFERLRTKFLNQGDNQSSIKVFSANSIIDQIEKDIYDNRLTLGSEEGSFELNSDIFHKQFDKLEYLSRSGFEKLIQARDHIYQDFVKQLKDKRSMIVEKIKQFISLEKIEQKNEEEKNDLDTFYSELSTFFSHVEKGIQINNIEALKNAMESVLNDINVAINKRFEEIQTEQLNILYSLSQKSDNDLSVLQQKSLQDLESEITFEITESFMKSIKKYYDILHKFSLSLRMSSKFNLYLDTDKRKKQLVRLLVFWFYVQEEIIRKKIEDVQKYSQIRKIYTQVKHLNEAGIVNSEISGRYYRLKNNLYSLVEKKQEEIKNMIPKLSEGIEIIQHQGIQAQMNNQPVSEYNLISLREAVRTIKDLSWTMPDSKEDYLSANKPFLLDNLERLVEIIQDQINDQRLDIDNIEDFRNVSKAFKLIEQISKIAGILDVELKNNSLNKFRPQIEASLEQIQQFIDKKKVPVKKQEEEKKEGQQSQQEKYNLLQIHECQRLNDYYQYLKTIKNNDGLINAIENFSKPQSEDNQEETPIIEPAQKIDLKLKIKTLYSQAEQFINDQIDIIQTDFKNKIDIILSYTQVLQNQNQGEQKSEENKEEEIDHIKRCLIIPIDSIIQHFKMFNYLKSSYKDLWLKIDKSNFIDDDFKSRINLLNLDLNQRIQQSPNNATNAPRLYNMLRVIYYLQPLAPYVADVESFQKSYEKSYAKITKFNTDVVEQAKSHILNSEYGEILKMIEELDNLKEPQSQENIQKITKEVYNRCRQLIYQIENNARQMIMSDQIQTIFDQKDKATQIDLNSAVKELICIKENEKWGVILGGDTFIRATKAIESLNKKLSNDNEECEAEIKYLIESDHFFEADELIKKQLRFLNYIDMSEKDKKFKDALGVFQSTLREKVTKVHEQFKCDNQDGNNNFMNLKDKKPAEIYANLGKSTTRIQPEFAQAQKRIIDTLKEAMKGRVKYLDDHITSDSFLRDLRQSQSSLASMPQQIKDDYEAKLEQIEKNYRENVKIEQDKLSFALKQNLDLTTVKGIIESNKYGVESSQKDLIVYFEQQCLRSSEVLKTDIISFFEKNLKPIWDFINVKRLQTVLGLHLREIQNLRETINELFTKATEIIVRSIKGEAEDAGSEQSLKFQKINEGLAAKLFLKQIELFKANMQPPILQNDQIEQTLTNVLEITNTTIQLQHDELQKASEKIDWKKYIEILERLKINDKYFNMLMSRDVEAFYVSNDRKEKGLAVKYNQAKDKMRQTNFDKMSKNLIPTLQKVREYFSGLKLLNQQTKNLINERNQFYEITNQNYQAIRYSQQVIEKLPNFDIKKVLDEIHAMLQSEVEAFIKEAQKIAENQNLKGKDFSTFKQLDDYLANLEAIQKYPDLRDIFVNFKQKYDLIKNTLTDQMKKSLARAKLEVTVEKAKNKVDTGLVAQELILLSNLSSIQSIKEQCLDGIKLIVEQMSDVQKTLQKNPQTKDKAVFIVDIAQILQGDAQGQSIVQDFNLFVGIKRRLEEENYPKKDVDYVLSKLKFNNGSQILDVSDKEKQDLKKQFERFNKTYMDLLMKYIGPQDRVQENLVTIKNNLQILVKLDNGCISLQVMGNIPEIVAHLFAIFTIQDSEVFHQNQKDGNLLDGKGYLLKPHAGQIIAIFRILGVGHAQVKNKSYEYDQQKQAQIAKFGKKQQYIFDNLAQIKTGEGKSYALGILSSIFALWGFNVSCASYSEYLSNRDLKSFASFFSFLGIQDYISYSTFNQVCENFINTNGDVRKQVLQKIMKDPTDIIKKIDEENKLRNNGGPKNPSRPQILLIDEVDVFFGSNFFGKMFSPTTNIKCPQVSQLLDYVWSQRTTKYLSLNNLKKSQQYKDCLNLFKDQYVQLFDASCKDMLFEVQNYKDHGYKVVNQKIGYVYQDQISYTMNFGYKTIFAHYHEFEQKQILQEHLENCKSISLSCAQFSYSEIPIKFALTLGVTGTLDALSPYELQIINNTFQIQNFSYIPSVYGDSCLDWERRANRIQVCNKDDFYNSIINEMKSNLQNNGGDMSSGKNRAVLIFFQNEQKLEQFRQSKNFKDRYEHRTLTEKIEHQNEKERIVFLATQPASITLSTPNFGRGTDFICRNKEVEANGGLHVILTFMCTQHSEFVQIQGRTARQGNKGSFSMVLLDDDLKDFNISLLDDKFKDFCRVTNDQYFEVLVQKRDELFNASKTNELEGIKLIKVLHEQSMNFQNQLLRSSSDDKIRQYLISINNDRQEKGQPIKTLILMDATGSMSNLIQKAKNSVQIMFEQTSIILENNGISPDLILIQFAVYRNYDCQPDKLFQHSAWESKPNQLKAFMEGIKAGGGICEEAVEVGLQHSMHEATKGGSVPLSQVFLIGDAPANPVGKVAKRRNDYGVNWIGTKFQEAAFWNKEAEKLASMNIPVHTFYVDEWAKPDFQQIAAITGGSCQFLDVNNQQFGQKMLIQKFSTRLLEQIGDQQPDRGAGFGQEMARQFIQRFN